MAAVRGAEPSAERSAADSRAVAWIAGAQPAEPRMRPLIIVVGTPGFEYSGGVREGAGQGLVEQLVAQAPGEGLGEGILHRLTRCDVVPADLVRHRSAVFMPASCSFRMAMICSSVCLLRFIVWSFPQGQTPVHPGSTQGGNVMQARTEKSPSCLGLELPEIYLIAVGV